MQNKNTNMKADLALSHVGSHKLRLSACITCLWKLSSLRALSSMVALVRRSPAREPGRFSSSWIRWAIRACSLHNKEHKHHSECVGRANIEFLNLIITRRKETLSCRETDSLHLYSLSWRISTGSSPLGFWMGVMRFCFWWSIMGGGCAGWPGDCVWGGITGEAAGGTEGGAGDGLPVGWGGINFWGGLDGAAAFTIGPIRGGTGGDMQDEVQTQMCEVTRLL